MKYFAIFFGIILMSTFSAFAYGLWVPLSPQELVENSSTVFVGSIISISEVERQYQSQIARDGTVKETVGPETITLDEYTVKVEEFLKNPQETETMKVLRATVSGVPGGPSKISGFEIGDRVLFYLPKDEKQTHFPGQYLPESFEIPQECDAKTVMSQPKIELTNSFDIMQEGVAKKDSFTAGVPMKFVYSKDMGELGGQSMDVTVSLRPYGEDEIVFEKNIHAESEPCAWIASAEWEFTPKEGEYRMYLNIRENGGNGVSTSYTGFSVISKLKSTSPSNQFNSGVPLNEIQCKENLVLIQKYDGTPACVKPETVPILMERGWAIPSNNGISFDIVSTESPLARFYAQPQLTSIILKQDDTVRVHLFSYIKESDSGKWDHVFDRIFDEVPKNFKIGIVEDTAENINDFVTTGKETLPLGLETELLREDGYFVVYLTSSKSLESGKHDLSIVSVDKEGTIIRKPLFVIVAKPDTSQAQDSIVKIFHVDHSRIYLENIPEQEYWAREDSRAPWPPSPIMNVTRDNIHPDVKKLVDFMWSEDAEYVPSKYDKNTLLAEYENSLDAGSNEIRGWLEDTYVQQFKRNLDDSFSGYFQYDGKIYVFGHVVAD